MSRQKLEAALTLDTARAPGATDGRSTALEDDKEAGLWVVALDPQSAEAWESVQRLTALQPSLPFFAISVPAGREASNGLTHPSDVPRAKPFDLPTLIQTVTQLLSQLPERGHSNLSAASGKNTSPCEPFEPFVNPLNPFVRSPLTGDT